MMVEYSLYLSKMINEEKKSLEGGIQWEKNMIQILYGIDQVKIDCGLFLCLCCSVWSSTRL